MAGLDTGAEMYLSTLTNLRPPKGKNHKRLKLIASKMIHD